MTQNKEQKKPPLERYIELLTSVLTGGQRVFSCLSRFEERSSSRDIPEEWQRGYWGNVLEDDDEETIEQDKEGLAALRSKRWGDVVADLIEEVRRWRSAIDEARDSIPIVMDLLDSPSDAPLLRASTALESDLRGVRSSINAGQPHDLYPSDLPWAGQEVGKAMNQAIRPIADRFELFKSLRYVLASKRRLQPPRSRSNRSRRGKSPTRPGRTVQRATPITKDQANVRAMDLLRQDPDMALRGARHWSSMIPCSLGLVSKLPIWKVTQARKRKDAAARVPKAISLTSKLEQNIDDKGRVGREIAQKAGDEALNDLITDQQKDFEPSPLVEGADGQAPPRERKKV